MRNNSQKIYTIGYGGRSKDEFLDLLEQSGVKMVVDIRLRPDRASMGIFVKAKSPEKGIQKVLAERGIAYVSLPELGNVFLEYEDWKQKYEQLLDKAGELLISRLQDVATPYCLLCAEKRVSDCHRRQLADYLVHTQGFEVEHLE